MTRTPISRRRIAVAVALGLSATFGSVPAGAQATPADTRGCQSGYTAQGFYNPDHDIRRSYPDRSVNLRADSHWHEVEPDASMRCVESTRASESLGAYRTGMRAPVAPNKTPNLGYVNYIVHNYYPVKNNPAVADPRQAAAIVQAAIWYFTDKFVQWRDSDRDGRIDSDDAINGPASRIVADALAHGPVEAGTDARRLAVNGPAKASPRRVAGPYSVAGNNGPATVTVTGAKAFEDAAGTRALPPTFPLPVGDEFFLLADVPITATIDVSAPVSVDVGSLLSTAADLTATLGQTLALVEAGLATLTAQLSVDLSLSLGCGGEECDTPTPGLFSAEGGDDVPTPEQFSEGGDDVPTPEQFSEGGDDSPAPGQQTTPTPEQTLAMTGVPVEAFLGLAAILLLLGLLAIRHRRRQPDTSRVEKFAHAAPKKTTT